MRVFIFIHYPCFSVSYQLWSQSNVIFAYSFSLAAASHGGFVSAVGTCAICQPRCECFALVVCACASSAVAEWQRHFARTTDCCRAWWYACALVCLCVWVYCVWGLFVLVCARACAPFASAHVYCECDSRVCEMWMPRVRKRKFLTLTLK